MPPGSNDAVGAFAWLPYALAALGVVLLLLGAALWSRSAGPLALRAFVVIRVGALTLIASMLVWLADAVTEGDGLTAIDVPVWSWMVAHRTAWLTGFMTTVTRIGGTAGMTVLAVAAVAILMRHRENRGDGVLVAIVAIGAGLLVAISKPLIGRTRPPSAFRLVVETNQSFPSGHALGSAAIIGVITVVVLRRIGKVLARAAILIGASALILLIGVSRLYLGVHWATDVIAGWIGAAGWLLACLTIQSVWRRTHVAPRATR